MCDPGKKKEYIVELLAPCGKKILIDFPEHINVRYETEDVGAALGLLMRSLGYSRRGWQLTINDTSKDDDIIIHSR